MGDNSIGPAVLMFMLSLPEYPVQMDLNCFMVLLVLCALHKVAASRFLYFPELVTLDQI